MFVPGSIRETVPSRLLTTQTAPAPVAIPLGPLPTGIVSTTAFVPGSIRDTVWRSALVTQYAPSPAATAVGVAPTPVCGDKATRARVDDAQRVAGRRDGRAASASTVDRTPRAEPRQRQRSRRRAQREGLRGASATVARLPAPPGAVEPPSGLARARTYRVRPSARRPASFERTSAVPPGVHGRSSLSPATDTRRAPPREAAGTARTREAPRRGFPRRRVPPSDGGIQPRETARARSVPRPTLPPPARRPNAGTHRQGRSTRARGCRRGRVASARPTFRLHRAGTAGAPVTPPTQPPPVPGRARLRRALLPRPVRRSRLRTGRPTFPRAGRAGSSRTRL